MQNQLNIPKILKVGFQNRSDTYSGKLAYVTWVDLKGKLRKEQSWNSWKDDEIPAEELSNSPTNGFVLNKGVGGARESYGWNARNEYIRIYDPRGFEFEISVANLLFILQETSSIKGKGLEGEFVYSWSGADLVLLPCCSQEYKKSKEFNKLQTQKITKKDMIEGYTYLSKDQEDLLYLGRHDWMLPVYSAVDSLHRTYGTYYVRNFYGEVSNGKEGKYHFFKNLKDGQYLAKKGFTFLAERTSEDCIPSYSDELEDFLKEEAICGTKKIIEEKAIIKESKFREKFYWGMDIAHITKKVSSYQDKLFIKTKNQSNEEVYVYINLYRFKINSNPEEFEKSISYYENQLYKWNNGVYFKSKLNLLKQYKMKNKYCFTFFLIEPIFSLKIEDSRIPKKGGLEHHRTSYEIEDKLLRMNEQTTSTGLVINNRMYDIVVDDLSKIEFLNLFSVSNSDKKCIINARERY